MTIFSEKNELKAGKKDWKKLMESKAPPVEKKEDKKEWAVVEAAPEVPPTKSPEVAQSSTSLDAPAPESNSDGPKDISLAENGDDSVDEMTKVRIAKIEEKKAALANQVKELEEEAAFLKEFGIKKAQLAEMQNNIKSLKDEMVSMKEGKKSGKTGAAPGNPNQSGNSTWDNVAKKEDSEVDKSEKNRSRGKKEWKKEVSDMDEGMTRRGKKPGKAEETDEDAPKAKKKNLKEGFERYMKTRVPAKDSGESPEGFGVVMG